MTFDDLEFKSRPCFPGIQAIVFFDNKYGASIVQGYETLGSEEGKYELAVLYDYDGDEGIRIVYDTDITDNVLGWLSEHDVTYTLAKIEALPPRIQEKTND